MRVLLDNAVLAGGGHESPYGLTTREIRLVQSADLVRGTHAVRWSRGNRRVEIGFTVTRLHDSLKAATVYVLEHAASLPEQGTLAMLYDDRTSAAGRWYRNAVLAEVQCVRHVGLTTVWRYTLLAGEVEVRDPKYTVT